MVIRIVWKGVGEKGGRTVEDEADEGEYDYEDYSGRFEHPCGVLAGARSCERRMDRHEGMGMLGAIVQVTIPAPLPDEDRPGSN